MSTANDIPSALRARDSVRGQSHCPDCCGLGKVHVQVPGKLMTISRECPCTKPGICLRCLGKGQHQAVRTGTAAGESLMCTYCQGTGRAQG